MRQSILSLVTIAGLSLLLSVAIPSFTFALPPEQASCSDTEVQITTAAFIVLPTVRAEIPRPLNEDEQCKITFSMEAATAQPTPQLLSLAYVLLREGEVPDPADCEFLPGPILTRVEPGGLEPTPGFDQTTTFISLLSEQQVQPDDAEIAPCFSILPRDGQQARLRRHCLIVECFSR
jgi:hypothetical protein